MKSSVCDIPNCGRDKDGDTLLHIVCQNLTQDVKLLVLLYDHSDLTVKNRKGQTAIECYEGTAEEFYIFLKESRESKVQATVEMLENAFREYQGDFDSELLYKLYEEVGLLLDELPPSLKRKGGITKRTEAAVYLKCSERFLEQKQLAPALEMSNWAFTCENEWYKVYKVRAEIFKQLQQKYDEFDALVKGLAFTKSNKKEQLWFHTRIVELRMACIQRGENIPIVELKEESVTVTKVEMLEHFAATNSWLHLKHVLKWSEEELDLSSICYTPLLKLSQSEWLDWGEGIVTDIIWGYHGNLEFLTYKENDTPLHAAVRMAIFSGSTSCLEIVLHCKQYLTSEAVNQKDSLGNSVVHTLVHSLKSYTPAPQMMTILFPYNSKKVDLFIHIRNLLKMSGANPTLKDAKGCLPIAYLEPGDECYSILKSWIEDRKENLPLVIDVGMYGESNSVENDQDVKLTPQKVKLVQKIDYLLKQGNLYIKNNKREKAVVLYEKADKILNKKIPSFETFGLKKRDIASMYKYLAEFYWDKDETVTCRSYALRSTHYDPDWFEARDMYGNMMKSTPSLVHQLNQYPVFLNGLKILSTAKTYPCEVIVKCLGEVWSLFELLERFCSENPFKRSVIPVEYWLAVLENFAMRGNWGHVKSLIKKAKLNKPPKQKNVVKILTETEMFQWVNFREKILVVLVSCTKNAKCLWNQMDISPLTHAALFAEKSGSTELLKNLLSHVTYKKPDNLYELDKDGLGVLHWLSQYYSKTPARSPSVQSEIYSCFKSSGMSPCYLDARGKTAIEYLNEKDTVFQILKDWACRFTGPDHYRSMRRQQDNPSDKQQQYRKQQQDYKKQKQKQKSKKSKQNVTTSNAALLKSKEDETAPVKDMCDFLNETPETIPKERDLKVSQYMNKIVQYLGQLGKTEDIPECILGIKPLFLKNIMKKAAKDWEIAFKLIKSYQDKTQKKSRQNAGEAGERTQITCDKQICSEISLKGFLNGLKDNHKKYSEQKECLEMIIAFEAKDKIAAAELAMQKGRYDLIDSFVTQGVDPCEIMLHYKKGTTKSQHVTAIALQYALEEQNGSFLCLEKLLQQCQDNPGYDPNISDETGNTLLHHAALCESKMSLEAVKILIKYGANPTLKNKQGLTPLQCLKEGDKRHEVIKKALRHPKYREGLKNASRNRIRELLTKIDVTKIVPVEFGENVEKDSDDDSEEEVEQTDKLGNDVRLTPLSTAEISIAQEGKEDNLQNRDQNQEYEMVEHFDEHSFDNLPWEVEFTAKALNILKNKKIERNLAKRIIIKIRRLACGEWRQPMVKRLKGVEEMELYEIKLDKGARIVWECAIAFSPRLTDIREDTSKSGQGQGQRSNMRMYTQVIRIWDIIFSHDHLERRIQKIQSSFKQGRNCQVRYRLKGQRNQEYFKKSKRVPVVFTEALASESEDDTFVFFPPAISKKTQARVLKMYSLSPAMANYVIHDTSIPVEFPFKETELEYEIIQMNPSQNEPIILLGRSGTGKTTCCLFRLWTHFSRYWKTIHLHGDTDLPQQLSNNNSSKELKTSERSKYQEKQDPTDRSVPKHCTDGATDHLHQVFITKNPVLCREVQKNFSGWSHSLPEAKHFAEKNKSTIPHRFQDVDFSFCPLFLTSKQFLLMLDESLPGERFFPRDEHGRFVEDVVYWTVGNESSFMADQYHNFGGSRTDTEGRNKKRGITYDGFVSELWPKLTKSKSDLEFHPSLVWVEICSFITGSFESLESENGYLTLEDYIRLGRKRASNFHGNREEVYEYFKMYQKLKQEMDLFDGGDLIYNLYQRLQKLEQCEWRISEIYVDETQDFTQAELWLLLHTCQNPNSMFLTGDTAQSIMRGVAFRFEDLKSLFYHANEAARQTGKKRGVVVPKKLYQLTHNYRSHSGILDLAASVIDLMVTFFPNSFDRLEKDKGLFAGPKPVLIMANTIGDLASLLTKKDKTTDIEFGANQVVLVSNSQAKADLPKELQSANILTIFESKGLEFNDVLLYNFFKNSQAKNEWRVVTSHLNSILDNQSDTGIQQENLKLINEDSKRPRPLQFDPSSHKILNSELKHLYTALTRAKVNIWIYDEDTEARKPVFEYFRVRNLVQTADEKDLQKESGLENPVFLEKSTPAEWEEQGNKFYRNGLFEASIKCFNRAGNKTKERIAKAQERVRRAKNLGAGERKDEFLFIAELFMKSNMLLEALKCLQNAQETELTRKLTQKMKA